VTLDLGCWLDESAVESPESRVEETRVEEMTQIERFEDIETKNSQELPVVSREPTTGKMRVVNQESGVENREHESRKSVVMGSGAERMAQITRFEDIEAWKKGRELAKDIYAVTGKGEFAKDYGLPRGIYHSGVIPRGERDQIQRAPWNKSQVAIPWGGPQCQLWPTSFTP